MNSAMPSVTVTRRTGIPRRCSSAPVITMPSAGDAGVTQPNPHRIIARRMALRRPSFTSGPMTRRSWAVRRR